MTIIDLSTHVLVVERFGRALQAYPFEHAAVKQPNPDQHNEPWIDEQQIQRLSTQQSPDLPRCLQTIEENGHFFKARSWSLVTIAPSAQDVAWFWNPSPLTQRAEVAERPVLLGSELNRTDRFG